ncbi:ATP-binding protein [Actinomadura logoneensis]|nr:ATP-binding protein [Actinomadura logoneensis]
MKFSLALPREALSIPVVRRVVGDALRGLGVSEDCVSDILVATSEACTNVVQHARDSADYEVVGHVADGVCLLSVLDRGTGGRTAAPASAQPAQPAQPVPVVAAGLPGLAVEARTAEVPAPAGASASFDPPAAGAACEPPAGSASLEASGFEASGPFDAPGHFDGGRFDASGPFAPSALRESGRGLRIMRALVDELSIHSAPDRGTVVQMHKRLTWRDEALIRRLEHRLARSAG